ncbi:MAG TPA: hypothetical protein VL096_04630, partial [Pirellulaceae bacterium]|nr:hypothetical protein [Pirellulaceae bacterium]
MSQDLITIYRTPHRQRAQSLVLLLKERAIAAWLTPWPSEPSKEDTVPAGSEMPSVSVAASDAEIAREIANEFEQQCEAQQAAAGSSTTFDDATYIWPHCPACMQRRLTVCPFCKSAGNDFELGYTGPQAEAGATARPIMVTCPTCDEAFHPQFYRLCEQCGHDFGDGIAVRQPRRLPASDDTPINTTRMVM